MSRTIVHAGLKELESGAPLANPSGRLHSSGGGRKSLTKHDPGLVNALKRKLEPHTCGDLSGPLQWTSKSVARLPKHLGDLGHPASERTLNRLLHKQGYSVQANRKTLEGRQHPDRDGQFLPIQRHVRGFQRMGNRLSRWTPGRRSWWARSEMVARNGALRDSRKMSASSQAVTVPANRRRTRNLWCIGVFLVLDEQRKSGNLCYGLSGCGANSFRYCCWETPADSGQLSVCLLLSPMPS